MCLFALLMKKISIQFLLVFILATACNNSSSEKVSVELQDSTKQEISLTAEETKKAERLDTLFSNMFNRNEFNGNVLIAESGKILYKKSFGIADVKEKRELSDSSLFQLASVSKTITACLTLQLVAEGKLDLEKEVKAYLPQFPYSGIKVRHLLNHRSGLFNYIYYCAEKNCNPTEMLSNGEILNMICGDIPAPYLKPDTKFNYCNTNYMLLALIDEKAGDKTFKQLVKEKIFDKCEMYSTYFADEIKNNKMVAKGYTFSMREVESDMFDEVWGDKGIYTTTYDLFLFEEAYFNGKLIPQTLLDTALKPYSPERKLGNYGYGWRMKNFLSGADTEKIVYHNGWWHGYRTALQRRLKDNVCIIILSNRLNKSVYETWRVFNALDGKQVEIKLEETEE